MKIQKLVLKIKKILIQFVLDKNIESSTKRNKKICPKAKKIAIISDKNIPDKFKRLLKKIQCL